jgi:hypothetical protein
VTITNQHVLMDFSLTQHDDFEEEATMEIKKDILIEI